MLTTLLRIVPQAGETPTMYRRRRAAFSRQNFQRVPLWSSQWFSRAIAWHNHVLRHPGSHSTRILAWHDSAWMRSRRQSLLPFNQRSWMDSKCGAHQHTCTIWYSSMQMGGWHRSCTKPSLRKGKVCDTTLLLRVCALHIFQRHRVSTIV